MAPYFYLFLYFASISLAGLSIAVIRMLKVSLPTWLGAVHGMAALFGLAAFFVVNLRFGDEGGSYAWWSLGIFSLGLIGGLIFFRVLFPKKAPIWTYAGHGMLAVIGLSFLYFPAFMVG